jgi:diadenosine tetraphosphate (Ap4A) HIT family hydrolase
VAVLEELTSEEREAIFELAKILKTALKKVFGATGFNQAWNEGIDAGQSVPHFHLHLVPRKEGDTGITGYDPRKFLYRPGSREKTPDSELSAVVEFIKKSL